MTGRLRRDVRCLRLRILPVQAFTLVEVLVSAVILTVGVIAIIQASNITVSSAQNADARTQVDALVSRDLNWLSWYAKTWNRSSISPSGILRYNTSQSCANLASDFLSAASAVPLGSGDPPKPFPVPASTGTGQVLQSVRAVNLTRVIKTSSSPSPERLEVTYTYPGSPAIERSASVLIQAGGWCRP